MLLTPELCKPLAVDSHRYVIYTVAAIHSPHLGPLPEAGRQLGPVPPARAYYCSTSQYYSQYYSHYYTGRIRRKVV